DSAVLLQKVFRIRAGSAFLSMFRQIASRNFAQRFRRLPERRVRRPRLQPRKRRDHRSRLQKERRVLSFKSSNNRRSRIEEHLTKGNEDNQGIPNQSQP